MFTINKNFDQQLEGFVSLIKETGGDMLFSDIIDHLPLDQGQFVSSVDLGHEPVHDRMFQAGQVDGEYYTSEITKFASDVLENEKVPQVIFDVFLSGPLVDSTGRYVPQTTRWEPELGSNLMIYGDFTYLTFTKTNMKQIGAIKRALLTFYGTGLFLDKSWSAEEIAALHGSPNIGELADSVVGFVIIAFDGDGAIYWQRRPDTLISL